MFQFILPYNLIIIIYYPVNELLLLLYILYTLPSEQK